MPIIDAALSYIGLQRMAVSNSPNDPIWANLFLSNKTASGVNVTDDKALQSSAVYACIRVIAEAVASLPILIYQKNSDDNSRAVASKHYLYPVLHDVPNEFQTSYELRETIMVSLLMRGNAFLFKEKNKAGQIVSLIPLNAAKMIVKLEGKTPLYEYTYEDGVRSVWTDIEIWHIKGLSSNGIIGLSPITLMRESIGLSIKMEEHGARLFGNYARPSGLLSTPGKLSENAAERLKKSWYAAQGGENVHKVAVLEEGLTWTSIGFSAEDSQFLQSRSFQIEDIARAFKVPAILIGHSNSTSTFASVEQQMISFVMHTLRPWLIRIEQSINKNLLNEIERKQGFFVEHKIEGLLRGNIQSRYAAYAIGRQNGWLSANEIREFENLNPIEDGDVYANPMLTPSPAQLNMEDEGEGMQKKI